ncbi:MAG: hypothetical protein ACRCU2_10140 [Planktothrix sp.]
MSVGLGKAIASGCAVHSMSVGADSLGVAIATGFGLDKSWG